MRHYSGMDEKAPDTAPRLRARALYWQGWRIVRIAEELDIPHNTVRAWKRRDGWDEATPLGRVEGTTEARYIQLVTKENKEGKDYKEIDLLSRQMERFARITRYNHGGNEADLNPNVANRNKGPKKKPAKNEFSPEQQQRLHAAFLDNLFQYQKAWHQAGLSHRIRNILKSRQIGATWYFGREALKRRLENRA